jgi:hypothetical protein
MQLHSCRLVCLAEAGVVGAVSRVRFGPLVCWEGSSCRCGLGWLCLVMGSIQASGLAGDLWGSVSSPFCLVSFVVVIVGVVVLGIW